MDKYECVDIVRERVFDYDGEVATLHEYFDRHKVRRVLELGCGTGAHCWRLAILGYACVGIDNAKEVLDFAKTKAAKSKLDIRFCEADIDSLRLDEVFDAVIMMRVPLPLNSLSSTIRDSYRLLSKDGLMAYMYLMKRDEEGSRDSDVILNTVDAEDYKIVQLNYYAIRGHVQDYTTVYFIQDRATLRVELDSGRIWLLSENDQKRLWQDVESYGYERLDTMVLEERKSAPPPLALEVLEVIKKK